MDLIKSGTYIDIFLLILLRNNKIKHSGGVSCSACTAFIYQVILVSGCMSVEDIRSQLQLNSEPQHRFCVVGTSITEWKSVHGALQTLCDLILDRSPR